MWIGAKRTMIKKPLGINWPSEHIKALGVFFPYDQSLLYEKKNFQNKLDSIKKLTNIWSSRGLSIYGKVTIIEGFGGKRALGFLLKIELCRKRSKFRMQFC